MGPHLPRPDHGQRASPRADLGRAGGGQRLLERALAGREPAAVAGRRAGAVARPGRPLRRAPRRVDRAADHAGQHRAAPDRAHPARWHAGPAAAAAKPAAVRQRLGCAVHRRNAPPGLDRRPGELGNGHDVPRARHHQRSRRVPVPRGPVAGVRLPGRPAGGCGDALAGGLRGRAGSRDGDTDPDHVRPASGRLRPGPGLRALGRGGRLRRRGGAAERSPLLRRADVRAAGLADQEHGGRAVVLLAGRPGRADQLRGRTRSPADLGPGRRRAGRGHAARRAGGDLRSRQVRRPIRHARRPGHGHCAVAGHARVLPGSARRRRADRGANRAGPHLDGRERPAARPAARDRRRPDAVRHPAGHLHRPVGARPRRSRRGRGAADGATAAADLDRERLRSTARRRHPGRPRRRPAARARHGRQLDGVPRPARPRRQAAVEPDELPRRALKRGFGVVAAAPGGRADAARRGRLHDVGPPGHPHRPDPAGLPGLRADGHRRPAVRDRSAARRRGPRRAAGQLHHLAALGGDRRHPGEQLPGPGGAGQPALQDPAPVGPARLRDAGPVRPGCLRGTGG